MYPESILPIAAHIPHAGTEIPEAVLEQFIPWKGELWREIAMLTDWYTDELFGMPGIAITQTPISRLVVDLERYTDDSQEEKAVFGQGVVYTHDTLGEPIRKTLSDVKRERLLDDYYRPWHLQLAVNVQQQLARWWHCLLFDCHSFPDEPFPHEEDPGIRRPDICLGVCDNTPQWLLDESRNLFLRLGYSVSVNFPYAGCLVPQCYFRDGRVPAIMIEVNRRLYLKPAPREAYRLGNTPIKLNQFDKVKNDLWSVALRLAQSMSCRLGTRRDLVGEVLGESNLLR